MRELSELPADKTNAGARHLRTWWSKTHVQDLKRAAADLRRIQLLRNRIHPSEELSDQIQRVPDRTGVSMRGSEVDRSLASVFTICFI